VSHTMETETISETSDINSTPTWLIARDHSLIYIYIYIYTYISQPKLGYTATNITLIEIRSILLQIKHDKQVKLTAVAEQPWAPPTLAPRFEYPLSVYPYLSGL
jgi:hypothetical protein